MFEIETRRFLVKDDKINQATFGILKLLDGVVIPIFIHKLFTVFIH